MTADFNADLVSLASNQFTLKAGTYYIEAAAPAFGCNSHQAWLVNATDTADLIIGQVANSQATTPSQTNAWVRGPFSIAAGKALEIQHRCQTTKATNGLGAKANLTTEVYTEVVLWRIR